MFAVRPKVRLILAIALGGVVLFAQGSDEFDARAFRVTLGNCSEYIGTGPVPVSRVGSLVPAPFAIAGADSGFATLVVRASLCRTASTDGSRQEPLRIAQVGVILVPPDGTGDINNYTLLYTTDNQRLGERLQRTGLPVHLDEDLVYEVTPDPPGAGGELFVEVSPPTLPAYFLTGMVSDPTPGSFPFVANWWYATSRGRIKIATSIPLLSYGAATAQLHTRQESFLGRLIGGNTFDPTGFEARGVFNSAVMAVTVSQ